MSNVFNRIALAFGCALVLGGCAAPAPVYYSLADVNLPAVAAAPAAFAIEVAPLAMPERLARPQMVIRPATPAAGPEVQILEQHRWSSSFESELRDAIASGVAARLGAIDATRAGRPRGVPARRISVQLRQFDVIEGSRVDASFTWNVRREDKDPVTTCQVVISEPAGAAIDSLALAAQRVTSRLSDAIARSVIQPAGSVCGS